MHTDTLIVGGGLAGLALADALHSAGKEFCLVEGRTRLGGRILSEVAGDAVFDLGPAWFWPGQLRMAALVQRLGLAQFDQYATGDLMYEDPSGVQRGQGFASMEGSYRLSGGFSALVEALEKALPARAVIKGAPITGLTLEDDSITATSASARISANRVVLAVPPRIAAGLAFDPVLPGPAIAAMQDTATWMAGQAKAVAVYDSPFWRDAGLSGDAMSRVGPMVEIHDASPESGSAQALFGFIGTPPDARQNEAHLRQHVINQLGRLFGPKAEKPQQLFIKDWAFDPMTSTQADLAPLNTHPRYGLPPAMANIWGRRILFGGTEVAPEFGGYLEGALEAAETAFNMISGDATSPLSPQR